MKKNLPLFTITLNIILLLGLTNITNAQTKRYVKPSATGTGISWSDASGDLQATIDASANGDSVFVAKGTYQRQLTPFYFSMKEGVKIYGSFQGTESSLTQRTVSSPADSSILRGNNDCVIYNYGNGLTNAAVLDGFTITGGYSFNRTGGIYNVNVSPTLNNLVIIGNSTTQKGAGIANASGAPIISNVKILKNSTTVQGGGIYNYLSNAIITNTIISGNTGGGVYNQQLYDFVERRN